jgi:hypothetical protein
MNYAMFGEWVKDRVEDLVRFGVPRDEAEHLMRSVESGSIAAEAKERSDNQFLLDFKRLGTKAMAARHDMTEQGVRKRRTKLLNRNREFGSGLRLPA